MTAKPVLSATVRRFLQKPRAARLCTIGPDGYPHIVPLFFVRQGDDLLFGSDRDERKVKNALANPKAAVVIGGEPATDEAGYMIQGDLSIADDRNQALLKKMVKRYKQEIDTAQLVQEWSRGDLVVIRLKPRRVIRVF